MTLFVTGVGSGLGAALAQTCLDQGWRVFAISRHIPEYLASHPGFHSVICDLSKNETIPSAIRSLLADETKLDLVLLNAGIIGELKSITETSQVEIDTVMQVNVWANKMILDALSALAISVDQVIAISSGAARNASAGWGAYSLSKAALNTLIALYAHEMEAHMVALAPGLVMTSMLEGIMEKGDSQRFPSVDRLRQSPKQTPKEAAGRIIDLIPKILEYNSGSFLDVREL